MTVVLSKLHCSGLCPLEYSSSNMSLDINYFLLASPSVIDPERDVSPSAPCQEVWLPLNSTNVSQESTSWFNFACNLVKTPVMVAWSAIKTVVVTVTSLSTFFGGAALFAAKNTQEVLLPLQPLVARAVRISTEHSIRFMGKTVALYASENVAYLVYSHWFRTLWLTYFALFTAAFFMWVIVYWMAVGIQTLFDFLFAWSWTFSHWLLVSSSRKSLTSLPGSGYRVLICLPVNKSLIEVASLGLCLIRAMQVPISALSWL